MHKTTSKTLIIVALIALILIGEACIWEKSIKKEQQTTQKEQEAIEPAKDQIPKLDEEEKTKETAEDDNWTTFKQDSGFRFQYPSNWEYEETLVGVKKTVTFKDKKNGSPTSSYIVFSFSTMPNQGGMTAEQWWEEAGKTSPYKKTGTAEIAGFQALKLEASETEAGPRFVFVTASQGGIIADISTVGLSEEILNKILDSFELSN